jgi:hypothetical protein
MRKKQMGVQMTAEVTEVLIRPGRPHFPIKARFGMVAVLAQTESVAVRPGRCFQCSQALRYKGMLRFSDVVLEGSSFSPIGNPAAHHRPLLSAQQAGLEDAEFVFRVIRCDSCLAANS